MSRLATLVARRDRLTEMGRYSGFRFNPYADTVLALDTMPHGNASDWNRRRIAARNRIHAQIAASGGAK